jgi:hypothetical protein
MIRIGLPPPVLPRLRLHWHITRTQADRSSRWLRAYAARTVEATRTRWSHVTRAVTRTLSIRAFFAARALRRLDRFEACYDQLVDLLCWTAKEGVEAEKEARYGVLRVQMRLQYRAARKSLRPYWDMADTAEARDPFEALFLPADLDVVINDVRGIETMMQTRAALDAYRDALENRRASR